MHHLSFSLSLFHSLYVRNLSLPCSGTVCSTNAHDLFTLQQIMFVVAC